MIIVAIIGVLLLVGAVWLKRHPEWVRRNIVADDPYETGVMADRYYDDGGDK